MSAGLVMAAAEHQSDNVEWNADVVTVMMRQIPRHITQQHLLQEVITHGFEGLFDFLYLPWDLKKGTNVGYGFISFSDPRTALSFRDAFDGTYLRTPETRTLTGFSEKPVRVHPASTQGYQANYEHFVHTKTGQKQDPLYSPLFFPGNGPNTLSRLLHTVCPGNSGQPKKAGSDGGTSLSFQAALAEAAMLGWEGLPADALAAGQPKAGRGGAEELRGCEDQVQIMHAGAKPKTRGRRRTQRAEACVVQTSSW